MHRASRDASVVKDKRKESQPFSFGSRKKHKTSTLQGFQGQGHGYQGQGYSQSSPGGRYFRA